MRHHKKTRILGRTKRGRSALLRNLARSLIVHGAVVTTIAKAKELRPFVERMVTESKKGTLASHRRVASKFGDGKDIAKKLQSTYVTRYASRSGGYTRIVKLGRIGKRVAEMARIELL